MGGRGSGGRRIGAGRKPKSKVLQAVHGNTRHQSATVLQHPSASAVAPVETFEPEPGWFMPPGLGAYVDPATEVPPPLADAIGAMRLEALQALAIWTELAPYAFTARTLTRATTASFAMLCR